MPDLAFTWWGHASGVVELGDARIALDPVFSRQLYHLRRRIVLPAELRAPTADLVLISHLHADHLHLPSLRRFDPATRLIVPRGAAPLFASMPNPLTEVVPGQQVRHGDVTVEVLPAHHDDRRMPGSRLRAPALGFRLADATHSVWYPGDTGLFDGLEAVAPVDLAIVPIGGWGPSLGEHHLDPRQAAEAVRRVGAEWTVPVHYGTLWPIGLDVARRTRQRLFVEPADRFTEEMRTLLPGVRLDVPAPGARLHPR